MTPYVKLFIAFAKFAKRHKGALLHATDRDGVLLAKDLGDALRRQMKIIQDRDLSVVETVYQVLPVVAEVKVLTFAVARKMKINADNKSVIDVLAAIAAQVKDQHAEAAVEIEKTLEWTRTFFAQDKIRDILEEKIAPVQGPKSVIDVAGIGRSIAHSAKKVGKEFYTLYRFVDEAKNPPQAPQEPQAPKKKHKGRNPKQ